MEREYYLALAQARIDRADELLLEANWLLDKGAYKSANNRAFYAIEKSIKALLATKEVEVLTHNGGLKQFNYLFIYQGDHTFTPEDYKIIAQAEQIRNASDYDDFYITSKDEAKNQVKVAGEFVNKVKKYLFVLKKS